MSQDVTRLCHETGLSATHALLQRFSPADRAGLDKMDYVWTVNGKEVDNEQVLSRVHLIKIDAFRYSR